MSAARKFGVTFATSAIAAAALLGLGVGLHSAKVVSPALENVLGEHGLIFGLILPLLIYVALFSGIGWIIAMIVSKTRKSDGEPS